MCRVARVLPEMMEEDGQSSVTSGRPCLGQLLAAVQQCPTPASRGEEDAGEIATNCCCPILDHNARV